MSKRYSQNYIEQEYLKQGLILLEKYESSKDSLKCKDKEGYLYYVNYETIKLNTNKQKFSIKNPYCYDNYNHFLEINDITTLLISKIAKKDCEKAKFKCGKCGNVFEKRWNEFYRGSNYYCKHCNAIEGSSNRALPYEKVKQDVEQIGFMLLDKTFTSTTNNINVTNKNGFKGNVDYNNLLQNKSFRIFHKANKFTIYNIKNYLKLEKIQLKLLSKTYVNRNSPLIFKCRCGNIFKMSLSVLKAGKIQCNECNKYQSSFEILVKQWLYDNKIKFQEQYQFEDCKRVFPLKYDFFIEGYGCIEVDGILHYEPKQAFNMNKEEAIYAFNDTIERDKIKNDYCSSNSIKLLRINYKDIQNKKYIEILKNELKSVIK